MYLFISENERERGRERERVGWGGGNRFKLNITRFTWFLYNLRTFWLFFFTRFSVLLEIFQLYGWRRHFCRCDRRPFTRSFRGPVTLTPVAEHFAVDCLLPFSNNCWDWDSNTQPPTCEANALPLRHCGDWNSHCFWFWFCWCWSYMYFRLLHYTPQQTKITRT